MKKPYLEFGEEAFYGEHVLLGRTVRGVEQIDSLFQVQCEVLGLGRGQLVLVLQDGKDLPANLPSEFVLDEGLGALFSLDVEGEAASGGRQVFAQETAFSGVCHEPGIHVLDGVEVVDVHDRLVRRQGIFRVPVLQQEVDLLVDGGSSTQSYGVAVFDLELAAVCFVTRVELGHWRLPSTAPCS